MSSEIERLEALMTSSDARLQAQLDLLHTALDRLRSDLIHAIIVLRLGARG